jgi:hypothetical protein
VVADSVGRYAEDPAAFNPTVPDEMRVDDRRFFVFFGRNPSITLVMRVLLLGGGMLEQSRGKGAYKALVLARWEDACRAGTPAPAVHAGQMSRPTLERLGFSRVAEITHLYDPATLPTTRL